MRSLTSCSINLTVNVLTARCRGEYVVRREHALRTELRPTLRVLGVGVRNLWDVAGEVARHRTDSYVQFDSVFSF